MKKGLLLGLTAAVFVVLSGATTLRADQLSLGDSCTSGYLTILGSTNPSVGGTVSGCSAVFEPSETNITPYSISSGTSLQIGTSSSDPNWLTGTIDWTSFTSVSSTTGNLVGFLTITGTPGSDYNGEYVSGSVYNISGFLFDCVTSGGVCVNALESDSFEWKPSAGEIPVPEPASLMLLGTGLLGMGGVVRRKFFRG